MSGGRERAIDGKSKAERDRISRDARRGNDFKGGAGGLGPNTPRGSKEVTAQSNIDVASKNPGLKPGDVGVAREALASSFVDKLGIGDTALDKIGNFIAGAWGWNEDDPNPVLNPYNKNPYADWSWDPGQSVANLAGMVTQLPIGTLYGLPSALFDWKAPWSVDQGSSVFGADYDPKRSFNDLAGISPSGGLPDQAAKAPQVKANPADIGRAVTPNPVAASRSTSNPRLSSYSGGGYNMGAFGKKPTKKPNYLTQQLMAG